MDSKDPGYAWVMVISVFTLSALSFGTLASISVFLKPLSSEFGWSRADTSLAYTVISFSSAAFGVFWGYIADKYGTRWFGIVAALMMSLSLFLLSKQTSIFYFYGFYFLFGAFGNAMVTSPLFANVGFWFRHNPGLALGITASGGAVGQGLIPYISGIIIVSDGWREAYSSMAIIYLLIAIPAALFIRESPRREAARIATTEEPTDFPLSEKEAITLAMFCSDFLLYLYVRTNCSPSSFVNRFRFFYGICYQRLNGANVLRCIWESSRGKARRYDRSLTCLCTHVNRSNHLSNLVPLCY